MKFSIPNIFNILFPLLVCSLYLPPIFYSLLLASLVVLAGIALNQGYRINYQQPLLSFIVCFFLIHMTGFFLGGNLFAVAKGLQTKLSFLFLPFVLAVFQPLLSRSFFRKLVAAFFYSTILFCVILLLISTNNLFEDYQLLSQEGKQAQLPWVRYFFSSILTHGYIHRSYLGLMIGSALISSPFITPKQKNKRFFFILGIGLLLFVLLLLQSRMILVAFVISQIIYVIIRSLQTRSRKLIIYLGLGLLATSIIGYLLADSRYNRFRNTGLKEYSMSDSYEKFTGTTIRLAIWENHLDLIKSAPILGTGYGNIHERRMSTYAKNNFTIGLDQEFNSHNQLIETQTITGIAGTVLLIGIFISIALIAFRRGDAHLFTLASFLFLSMLTEAMFERQFAIAFFSTYILSMAIGEKIGFKQSRTR